MDIFNIFSSLVKESVSFKAYKGLHPFLRVLCFIILLPFIIVYTAMLLVYLLMATVYKLVHSAFDYLYGFVHGEGKVVNHATQAIIYLIAFPLLFAFKVVYSVLIYPMVILHFLASHVGYIATFGGIKYSPFMLEPVDRLGEKGFAKHCKAAVIVFVIFGILLLVLSASFRHVSDEIYRMYKEDAVVSRLVDEMKIAKNDHKISGDDWNSFASAYNAGKITAENYTEYRNKYLGYSEKALWDVKEELEFYKLVELIYLARVATYVLFVSIYVPAYSNAIKRRKNTEVCEETEPVIA